MSGYIATQDLYQMLFEKLAKTHSVAELFKPADAELFKKLTGVDLQTVTLGELLDRYGSDFGNSLDAALYRQGKEAEEKILAEQQASVDQGGEPVKVG